MRLRVDSLAVLIGQLQGLDAAAEFVHVPADRSRVLKDELDLFERADDEDRTDRQRQSVNIDVLPGRTCCTSRRWNGPVVTSHLSEKRYIGTSH